MDIQILEIVSRSWPFAVMGTAFIMFVGIYALFSRVVRREDTRVRMEQDRLWRIDRDKERYGLRDLRDK